MKDNTREKGLTETQKKLNEIKDITEIILPDELEVTTIRGEKVIIPKPSLRKQIPLIQEIVGLVSQVNEFKGLDFKSISINQLIEIFISVIPRIASERMAELIAFFFLKDEDFKKEDYKKTILKEKQDWILDNLEFSSLLELAIPFLLSQVRRTSDSLSKIIKLKVD